MNESVKTIATQIPNPLDKDYEDAFDQLGAWSGSFNSQVDFWKRLGLKDFTVNWTYQNRERK